MDIHIPYLVIDLIRFFGITFLVGLMFVIYADDVYARLDSFWGKLLNGLYVVGCLNLIVFLGQWL